MAPTGDLEPAIPSAKKLGEGHPSKSYSPTAWHPHRLHRTQSPLLEGEGNLCRLEEAENGFAGYQDAGL
jgi:hypothetical protein